MNGKVKSGADKTWVKILIFIAIVLLFEIICNYKFFLTLGYEPVRLTSYELNGNIEVVRSNILKPNGDNEGIRFNNLDMHISNIYIDAEKVGADEDISSIEKDSSDFDKIKSIKELKGLRIQLNADDEGNAGGINMPTQAVVSSIERTKYITLNLSGSSQSLSLNFLSSKDKEIKINEIIINKPVPFQFSFTRVLAVAFILGLILAIKPSSKLYEYKLDFKSKNQRIIVVCAALIQAIVMLAGVHVNPMYVYNTVSWQNQYNELTEAITQGHFYLNTEPDEKLAELENPYDPSERNASGANVSWDHAYYNGKYYVYFGIVPALIFNLPVYLLTGKSVMPLQCIEILLPLFVLFSYLLIYQLVRRLKANKLPLLSYIMLCTIFVFSVGIPFVLGYPDMYTLPIMTALVFAVGGLYFWLSSFRYNESDYSLSSPRLAIGSLMLALISGCRPQMLLVLFLAVPLFYPEIKAKKLIVGKNNITRTICFVLPILVVASFICFYNYARFGSVLDFGANYNLTTNDMTARGFDIGRGFQGLFYYLLQPLELVSRFPFINSTAFDSNYMGMTYKEATYGGILFLQPLIWLTILIPSAKDELKKHRMLTFTVLLAVFSVVMLFADSIMGGLLYRYYLDFTWLGVLAAVTVFIAMYNKYNNSNYINILKPILVFCLLFTLTLAFLLVIGGRSYSVEEKNPELFWYIARLVQFWL